VVPNLRSKSMLAFKSFAAVHTIDKVRAWLDVLATELVRHQRAVNL
jgi:hypothetical protein